MVIHATDCLFYAQGSMTRCHQTIQTQNSDPTELGPRNMGLSQCPEMDALRKIMEAVEARCNLLLRAVTGI